MFYPIPSLNGKYEINKSGVVRNAKTKAILKTVKPNRKYYHFRLNGRLIGRNTDSLVSEVFEKEGKYLPIPSLNGKYEINRKGIVRNAKTKKRLRTYKDKGGAIFVSVKINVKYSHRYVQQLMWEVHGILSQKVCFLPSVAVTIQKGTEHYSFSSMNKCAKFLAEKEHYSFSWCNYQLQQRRENIYGWKVFFYKKVEQADISRPSQFIRRRKKKNENN